MTNICTNKLELSVSKSWEKNFLDEDGDFNFNVEELLPASEDFSVFNYPFEVTLDKVSYDNVSRITWEKLTTFFVTFATKWRTPMDLYKKIVALDCVEKLVSYCDEPWLDHSWMVAYDYKEELDNVTRWLFSKWESLTYFIKNKSFFRKAVKNWF